MFVCFLIVFLSLKFTFFFFGEIFQHWLYVKTCTAVVLTFEGNDFYTVVYVIILLLTLLVQKLVRLDNVQYWEISAVPNALL